MQATCEQAKGSSTNNLTFDTDSYSIGIDNRCTACLSHKIQDFEGALRDTKRSIRGYGGITDDKIKIGTIKWSIIDDQGKKHTFKIPNSFYAPQGGVRLLSPQHWAKHHPSKKGDATSSRTTHDKIILSWNGGKSTCTTPLGPSNVANLNANPGYSKYEAFCDKIEINNEETLCAKTQHNAKTIHSTNSHKIINFDMDSSKLKEAIPENLNETKEIHSSQRELLLLHKKMGHISMTRLQNMAKQQMLPKHISKCVIPRCMACMFGKATRKPWRNKPYKTKTEKIKPSSTG